MSKIATTNDVPAAAATPDSRIPTDDRNGGCATVTAPPQGLLDRISEAVRAAHAASVPF